jgi:cell division protein FtsW
VLLLTLLGLVVLYSASYLFALNQPYRFKSFISRFFPAITSGWVPLVSNIIACTIMLVVFPFLALIRLEWLKNGKVIFVLVLFTSVVNLLPLLFSGGSGAGRWIISRSALLSFQPSELIKVVLPLYMAYILDKNNDKLTDPKYGPLPPALLTFVFCALVFAQSNLSDVILILATGVIICFVAGIRMGWFLPLLGLIPLGIWYITSNKEGRWYRRIASHFSTEMDPHGEHHQIMESMEAIQSGGFWGKGIGQGTMKISIPEVHGDFVFAAFAEETGFLGVLFYVLLIGVFAFISYRVASLTKNRFNRLLAFGLVTPIVLQSLVNVAVVAKLVVSTGVPLPFVSSGGSSLLVTLASSALLVNICRRYVLSEDMEV